MKYVKKFNNHNDYNTYITGNPVLPNVSYCETLDEVHYTPWYDPERFVAKFNITNTATATYIFNNPTLLKEIEIDGVVQPSIITSYTFPTTGIHTVKYTLVDGITNIDSGAFGGRDDMISITIPKTIITIGSGAFGGCYNIKKITIPNTVTTIGSSAFAGCHNLESIYIPSSVTSIGSDVFQACINMASIVVSSDNSVYDSRNNCNAIIDTAYNNLIVGCKNTIIPNTVTDIGASAFYGCIGLESITIPSSVTYINGNAFSKCYITSDKFINNSNLDEVSNGYWLATIIDSDTNGFCIKNNTLYGYRGTSNNVVIIPNTVTSISNEAFSYYKNITSVTIPNSVTSIGKNAFSSCTGLINITIPSSVTSIGNEAFSYCTNLTSINIPNSVTIIGNNAFAYCRSLTNVIIPDSVTSIGYSAFNGCMGLTNITISNSVTSIGNGTFGGCGLTSITIPNSVTTIGESAFSYCDDLTSITSLATTAPTIQNNTFRGVKTGGALTVPIGSIGYDTWMGTGNYYLGLYNWTKVEQ